jgi:hypothetical protein
MSPFMALISLVVLIGAVVFVVGLVMRKRKVILIGAPAALLLVIWFFLASSRPNPQKEFDRLFGAGNRGWPLTFGPSNRRSWTGTSSLFVSDCLTLMLVSDRSSQSWSLAHLPTYFSDSLCLPVGLPRLRRLHQCCIVRLSIRTFICFTSRVRRWRMHLFDMISGDETPNHQLCPNGQGPKAYRTETF